MMIRLIRGFLHAAVLLGVSRSLFAQDTGWRQWGGPGGDFVISEANLADKWPATGPKKLWSKELGEGYSAIVTDGKTLYTMYRRGEEDVVVALVAASGKNKWQRMYPAPTYKEQKLDFGKGPNATPLLLGDRLITIGFTGKLNCLNTKNGKVLWARDLVADLGAKPQEFGYSASPIAYHGNIIALVGGEQTGVMAFDPTDGNVVWKSAAGDISYASPVVIAVDGEDQVAYMSPSEVVGISAKDGTARWRHPHENQYKNNCFTPIWDGKRNLLFVTSHTDAGTRVLHLSREGDQTKVKETWFDKKTKMFHSTAVRVGDYLYGSLGDQPPTFLSAIRLEDGKVLWKERGFPKANVIYADGKLIVLDEDGQLALAKVSPEKCEIVSRVQLLEKVAWTVPTLDKGRLFIRDRKSIMALDVGKRRS